MSMAKVAKLAGVSNTTVSFVVNNKPGISFSTISRVKSAMKEIGYVPRSANSKNGFRVESSGLRTRNIGVVMGNLVISTIPFYARLFDVIHHALDDRQLKMVPLRISGNPSLTADSVSDLDGVVLCCYFKELADKLRVPFVSVLDHPDIESKLYADHIEPANDRIGAMAARYFIDRGHKKILAIDPKEASHPPIRTRVQYFVSTAQKYGVAAEPKDVPFTERDGTGRLNDGSGIASIQEFISDYKSIIDRPTGIFVPSDSHLVILQKSFRDAGIRPGVDVEFLGCNNESALLDGLSVRPATIDINPEAIARAAVNILLRRIGDPAIGEKIFQMVRVEPSIVAGSVEVNERW